MINFLRDIFSKKELVIIGVVLTVAIIIWVKALLSPDQETIEFFKKPITELTVGEFAFILICVKWFFSGGSK